MRHTVISIAFLGLFTLGCDALSGWREALPWSAGGAATAERPEGWESLEGEGSALRLYYQFVDASRRVRFVERLEDVPEALRDGVGFVKLDVAPPLSPGDAARARRARASGRVASASGDGPQQVVLYSAEWCGACRKAKRYLSRQGVGYEERDVDQSRHADLLLQKTGSRAIPVLEVDGRMLTGYSASSYDRILEAS